MSWTRKLLPRSLRSRLILSFGILIFLSLFLAGITTVYLLRQQQEKAAQERVGLLALPVMLRSAFLEANGLTPDQILSVLEQEYAQKYDVRVLLIDGATVVGDSGQTLLGETITQLGQQGVPSRPLSDLRYQMERYHQGPDDLLLFISSQGPAIALPGAPNVFVPEYQAAVAVNESDIHAAWRDLLPRLFMAGGIAFLASVIAASLLARTITRPLRTITAASEEMARGRYDQQLPVYSGEEVSRLASAFNDMAQRVGDSYRTLRDFLANVSHELKTPLTSIQGFSQAMVDGSLKDSDEYAEAGRIINDEAVRMRGLVDDLLYLSQVEAGEVSMQMDDINPAELLNDTVERFQRRARLARVEVAVRAATTPQIHADGRRMEQAVANIVDNAMRFTPAGGRITLSATSEDGHVDLSVHNTGSVIPPEAIPMLFDRFFQVDPARARADGNSGLGLAITKEIVEAHGGNIAVHSSQEEGTEFVISLPARPEPPTTS